MPIQIYPESKRLGPPYENCCFCYKPTPYWSKPDGDGVPVCVTCSEKKSPKDLPSKYLWYVVDAGLGAITYKVGDDDDD